MAQKPTDDFHGQGGSYEIRDGVRVRVEEPTAPTDTGGARDADGKPLVDEALETHLAEVAKAKAREEADGK